MNMGRFLRPETKVLPDEAMIPLKNLISPAPNQFTHELTRAQPFHYAGAHVGKTPDGVLPANTKVTLLFHDGGAYCWVADGSGLYVEIEYNALRKL
jgi:hypothetical protein